MLICAGAESRFSIGLASAIPAHAIDHRGEVHDRRRLGDAALVPPAVDLDRTGRRERPQPCVPRPGEAAAAPAHHRQAKRVGPLALLRVRVPLVRRLDPASVGPEHPEPEVAVEGRRSVRVVVELAARGAQQRAHLEGDTAGVGLQEHEPDRRVLGAPDDRGHVRRAGQPVRRTRPRVVEVPLRRTLLDRRLGQVREEHVGQPRRSVKARIRTHASSHAGCHSAKARSKNECGAPS